ncbi:hypothetical protein SAMN00777080_2822 [Aquiflexum balticum DSM 16537]|uniref:Uncharacterized protein n=1 Tax=Aquiflexum balticum DSM 16537 TaxID=758820 RepID=A0A1W2H605_9BACT|nr:hypothetical protein SAMN00777080_2822 [Aquiflexum balticum DSM 16537]
MTKIDKSIVATGGSSISNSKNEIATKAKRLKTKFTLIGFILGVLSSLVASYIYDYLTKS